MQEEEEEEEKQFFFEDDIIKLNTNANYSISELNDDISTYTGVRSLNEDNSIINNNAKNKQGKNNKTNKVKKKKKKETFCSISEKSNSSSESRKSFKDLIKPKKEEKKLNKEKEINEKEQKEKEKEKNTKKENEYKEKEEKYDDYEENLRVDRIETRFEWDEGGELVYLTGSFCDWKEFYKMRKNNEGIFTISLYLPKGFHQYKFKVDENWEYSKKQPKYEDNGNVNNFIDTSDFQSTTELGNNNKEGKNNDDKSGPKKKTKKKKKRKVHKRFSSIHTINFLNSQNNYTIYYPLKSELNKKPSSLPGLYKTCFILSEDFKRKKEKKFSQVEYINNSSNSSSISSSSSSSSLTENSSELSSHSKVSLFGEIIPYVKFQNLYHIHSNHLHSKIFKYNNNTVSSMTLRYRFKLSTFIYYKSYKSKEKKRRVKHSQTVKINSRK